MSLYFPRENEAINQIRAGDAARAQLQQVQDALQAQGITAEQALALYQQQPNASPGLLGSSLLGGLDPQTYGQVAAQDPGQDTFRWYDPSDWVTSSFERATEAMNWVGSGIYEQVLKPLVRGAFAVTEGLSQELVQRPLSAVFAGLGGADQDVSIREAYNQYGTSAFFQALGNVIGEDTAEEQALQGTGAFGSGFDLGQGFFPGGAAQAQADEDRLLTVQGQAANLGRLFWDPVMTPIGLEPGERTYDIVTGVTQFAFDVLTDPSILLSAGTGGIAKTAGRVAAAGARATGVARSADDLARISNSIADFLTIEGTSQRLRAARSFTEVVEGGTPGIVSGLTEAGPTGKTVAETLSTPRNRILQAVGLDPKDTFTPQEIGRIVRENADNEEVRAAINEAVGIINGPNGRSVMFDKAASFFRNDGVLDAIASANRVQLGDSFRAGRDTSLPSEFIDALGEASTREEVAAVLTEAITKGHITDRNFYGGFSNRVGNALRATPILGDKIEKFSGVAARGFLDAFDKDVALGKLDTLARQAGLTLEDREWIFEQVGKMQKGDQSAMFDIATEVYGRIGSRILKDDPDRGAEFIRGITNAYSQELEKFRAYFVNEVSEVGGAALPTRTIKKYMPDGTVVDVELPQPHLLNEFNQMLVPIPDVDDIRRAATKSDTMRKVYESAGWKWTNRALRFVTRGVFKPLVLLRPAYIARTQLDDQLRMWAAGVDGIFANPRHLLQMASKAGDELADLASRDPSVAAYARKILNQSILDVDGDSIAKPLRQRIWTTLDKRQASDPENVSVIREEMDDFITAWRHELGQLSNDQVAAYLARNNLDIDSAVAEIMGFQTRDPEWVAQMQERQEIFRLLDETFGTFTMKDWQTKRPPNALKDLKDRALLRYRAHVAENFVDDRVSLTRERLLREASELDLTPDEIMVNASGRVINPNEPDFDPFLDGFGDDMPPPEFTDTDELLGIDPLNEVEPDFFPDPEMDDLFEEETFTLEEYLARVREDVASDEELKETFLRGIERDFDFHREGTFTAPKRVQWMVSTLLEENGIDPAKAADFADEFTHQWVKWTDSQSDPFLHQNTIREGGLLNQFVRASSKAGHPVVYRGQAIPTTRVNQMLADGTWSEGEILRINRLSSATTRIDQPSTFMSLGATHLYSTGQGKQGVTRVLMRMDGEVRGANMSWASTEGELILPDQPMRIREVRKVSRDEITHESYEYVDPVTDEVADFYVPEGEDLVIIELEGVKDGSITQKVAEQGPQPFMRDMNLGAYDGSVESLAGKAWDDLSPSERSEYTAINEQIQTYLADPRGKGAAFLQYHSELRHLVDNAPTVPDHIYLSGDQLTLGEIDQIRGIRGTDPQARDLAFADIKPGDVLRSDQNRPWRRKFDEDDRDGMIRERMSLGEIDPWNVKGNTVIRLPKGSQALRVDKDGRYLVPPTQMRVVNITERGGKRIVDVEIEYQPRKGKVRNDPDPRTSTPLRDYIERTAWRSNHDARRLLDDEDYLRDYLKTVVDRIQIKTGGNQRLIDILKREQPVGEGAEDWVDLLEDDAAMNRLLAEHYVNDAPAVVKAQRFDGTQDSDQRDAMDMVTAWAYDVIVSKPAAYLSRYPAWVEFMARDGAALMPQMFDDAVRSQFLDVMEEMGATGTQMRRLRAAAEQAKGKQGVIGSAEEARELALMHATESVENLLFDVTNKSAFQDAFDVIFPFVDAWREGISVWSRLIKENPALLAKGMAGFRASEETGMIYTNERGERMFSMPASGTLANFIARRHDDQNLIQATYGALFDTARGEIDDEQIRSIQTELGFNLSGVNLMFNSIGPGFGPVVQWPAGAFLPDTPEFVGLQELINPYGTPFEDPSDLANPITAIEALAPSWAKKVINAWGGGRLDPIQWNAAVHDALRALEMSGNYDPNSLEDRQRLTDDAERSARWMLFTRGLVHSIFLTSPSGDWKVRTDGVDEDFEPWADWDPDADPDGVWHQINSLASSYYDMYERYGDHTIAEQEFIKAYGVTPAYLRTPKSRVLSDLPATKEAAFWAEDNREAMTKYPLVAGLFAPPDEGGENFDYGVWIQQFRSGMRETISPQDQIALASRTQAQQIYYNAKDRLEALDISTNQQRTILAAVKAQLNEQFPGWEIGIAGVTNVPTDQKIEQLRMAANDPLLADQPLTASLQQYFSAREQFLAALRAESGSPSATLGREDAEQYRVALTQIGATLASQSPEFRGAWELLRREVD